MAERLKLVVGKSGSGKNYICDLFKWKAIPSYTTRPIRDLEKEGREHIFVTDKEWTETWQFVEKAAHTWFNRNNYWTTIEQVEDWDWDAYVIDIAGIEFMMGLDKIKRELLIVEVVSPWYKRLYRMIRRDGIKKAINRFKHDIKEFDGLDDIIEKYGAKEKMVINN